MQYYDSLRVPRSEKTTGGGRGVLAVAMLISNAFVLVFCLSGLASSLVNSVVEYGNFTVYWV